MLLKDSLSLFLFSPTRYSLQSNDQTCSVRNTSPNCFNRLSTSISLGRGWIGSVSESFANKVYSCQRYISILLLSIQMPSVVQKPKLQFSHHLSTFLLQTINSKINRKGGQMFIAVFVIYHTSELFKAVVFNLSFVLVTQNILQHIHVLKRL